MHPIFWHFLTILVEFGIVIGKPCSLLLKLTFKFWDFWSLPPLNLLCIFLFCRMNIFHQPPVSWECVYRNFNCLGFQEFLWVFGLLHVWMNQSWIINNPTSTTFRLLCFQWRLLIYFSYHTYSCIVLGADGRGCVPHLICYQVGIDEKMEGGRPKVTQERLQQPLQALISPPASTHLP